LPGSAKWVPSSLPARDPLPLHCPPKVSRPLVVPKPTVLLNFWPKDCNIRPIWFSTEPSVEKLLVRFDEAPQVILIMRRWVILAGDCGRFGSRLCEPGS
jgi:hypothetical protein